MSKIAYKTGRMGRDKMDIVNTANEIIAEYQAMGYSLSLRQVYYRFVAQDLIPNTEKSYKRLGGIINDGRLFGLIDWEAIEDRTRGLETLPFWSSPSELVDICARTYKEDVWASQPYRIEVWVEKDALAGIVETACRPTRVPYLSCRGYLSQSEMWAAGIRLKEYSENRQRPVILHLGDHDPSGRDMSRDIEARLRMFMEDEGDRLRFERIALNWDQIQRYQPPPNPAKITDSRAQAYIDEFGDESWELDALTPQVITGLINDRIRHYMSADAWAEALSDETSNRQVLHDASQWVQDHT